MFSLHTLEDMKTVLYWKSLRKSKRFNLPQHMHVNDACIILIVYSIIADAYPPQTPPPTHTHTHTHICFCDAMPQPTKTIQTTKTPWHLEISCHDMIYCSITVNYVSEYKIITDVRYFICICACCIWKRENKKRKKREKGISFSSMYNT